MKPYNVEIFTQDFEMVGNTNVNEITYKEDYLSSDDNTVTVLALPGVEKQEYIRISRGQGNMPVSLQRLNTARTNPKSYRAFPISLSWSF